VYLFQREVNVGSQRGFMMVVVFELTAHMNVSLLFCHD